MVSEQDDPVAAQIQQLGGGFYLVRASVNNTSDGGSSFGTVAGTTTTYGVLALQATGRNRMDLQTAERLCHFDYDFAPSEGFSIQTVVSPIVPQTSEPRSQQGLPRFRSIRST